MYLCVWHYKFVEIYCVVFFVLVNSPNIILVFFFFFNIILLFLWLCYLLFIIFIFAWCIIFPSLCYNMKLDCLKNQCESWVNKSIDWVRKKKKGNIKKRRKNNEIVLVINDWTMTMITRWPIGLNDWREIVVLDVVYKIYVRVRRTRGQCRATRVIWYIYLQFITCIYVLHLYTENVHHEFYF